MCAAQKDVLLAVRTTIERQYEDWLSQRALDRSPLSTALVARPMLESLHCRTTPPLKWPDLTGLPVLEQKRDS